VNHDNEEPKMKYMMFVCTDTEPQTDESQVPDIDTWVAENDAAGRRVSGSVLDAPASATTVRVRNGETLLIDGPFAETKEVIAGFTIIEVASREEALEWVKRWPEPNVELELRPVFELSDFSVDPAEKPDGWRAKEQALRDRTSG
jgi:hypothetical protein